MSRTIYQIEEDLGESDRYSPIWTSKFLVTHGNDLNELLDNAEYFFIDQDGGEVGDSVADDRDAYNFIKDWYYTHRCPEVEDVRQKDPMDVARDYYVRRDEE